MSLPGADELFRATGGMALSPSLARSGEGRTETARTAEPGGAPADGGRANGAPVNGAVNGVPGPAGPAGGPQAGSGAVAAPGGAAEGQVPGQGAGVRSGPHAAAAEEAADGVRRPRAPRGRGPRRPTGRERHDEKITVYVSAEELMDLESARLVLRGEHGLAVDRGRVVREAISVVLADLEQRGEASILVRRLRGR
ncbi:hypothetical protein ACGFX4_36575 [Kitasatospora sp. NPDC048365]|uniref:hypothetical protein n=1 Tax=Kitasatospora sp. NPDC048365 TaxID=3364050 RepID=UPI00371A3FF7